MKKYKGRIKPIEKEEIAMEENILKGCF